ncbi:MAG: DegQ family serine endoprotease [Chromatiales bacterium]|nr:DegQ family serine endoprotease [Chromatiales bacterium]
MIRQARFYSVFAIVMIWAGALRAHDGLPQFADLVDRNAPAVVNISTKQHIAQRKPNMQIPNLPEDSPFHEFFRHFFNNPEDGEESPFGHFDARSLGSGFIISEDGYVLTNAHVVDDADEIVVRLNDRREFTATVVGIDKRSDVAVLKIDARGLPTVKVGDDATLRTGDWVLAIGSPFGFEHTVTKGIVSAKGRNLPSENYVPFIQTDVPINVGNSGGPLFDLDGKVVGINSQIYSRNGGFMGLSFAIPISIAMNVADQLRTTGHVSRGWLGVLIQDVDRELARSFGMDHPHGALVAQILDDSPARDSELRVGDVILEFNGRKVGNSAALPPLVGAAPVDKNATVLVLRDNRSREVQVRIGALPNEDQTQLSSRDSRKDETPREQPSDRLGLVIEPLDDAKRRNPEIEANHGVVVVKVTPESAADSAGLRRGDVIVMIDGRRVDSLSDAESAINDLKADRSVAVLVERAGSPMFIAVRVPRA